MPKKETSILIITPFTWPSGAGGGINAYRWANFLKSKGFRVAILCRSRYNKKNDNPNFRIIRVPYYSGFFISKLLSHLLFLFTSLCIIPFYNRIVLYSSYTPFWQFNILYSRLLKKPILFRSTLIGEDDPKTLSLSKTIIKGINKFALKRITSYHSINPFFTKLYVDYIGSENKIIQAVQGVDLSYFKPVEKTERENARRLLGFSDKELVILAFSPCIERKGYPETFRAINQLSIPFKLVVVGANLREQDPYLRSKRAEITSNIDLGKQLLGDRVAYYEHTKDIISYYNIADIVLINSKSEGTPNILLEAMACGLPVICKNLPGISDFAILDDKIGMLFNSIDEVKSKIELLYNKPLLREELGRNARAFAVENFSFETTYTKLNKFYSLINEDTNKRCNCG